MLLSTIVGPLKRALDTNSTDTSFSAGESGTTTTRPASSSTRFVHDCVNAGPKERNTMVLVPFGGNDDNDTFSLKVQGWMELAPRNQADLRQWVSLPICTLTSCTLASALLGDAGRQVVVADLFCDAITLSSGVAVIYSGTADVDIAWAQIPVGGFELIEVLFDLTSGGDGANFLYGFQ